MAIKKGIWYYGDIDNINVLEPFSPVGVQVQTTAADIETAEGVYDWTPIEDAAAYCDAHDMDLGISISTNNLVPAFVLTAAGSYSTTGGSIDGPYPYQKSTAYITWLNGFWTACKNKIIALEALYPGRVKYFAVRLGTTGDWGLYKGTLVDYDFSGETTFTTAAQKTWIHARWAEAETLFASISSYCALLRNPGNDNTDYDYIKTTYPNSLMKNGLASHNLLPDGEAVIAQRDCFDNGEVQGIFLDPTFASAYLRNTYLLIAGMMGMGVDMALIPQGLINNAPDVSGEMDRIMTFGNKWLGVTSADKTGCIVLKDSPDFLDDARFDEDTYETVIDPAQLTAYNTRVAVINASSDGAGKKALDLVLAKKDHFNAARKDAILAAFVSAGANYVEGDISQTDLGFGLLKDYSRNITQLQKYTSCTPSFNIGDVDESCYGRQCVAFDDEIFFTFNSLENKNYALRVDVVFLDTGLHQWRPYYHNGTTKVPADVTFSNTDSDEWNSATFHIDNFQGGGRLAGGADMTLKLETELGSLHIQQITFHHVVENPEPEPEPDPEILPSGYGKLFMAYRSQNVKLRLPGYLRAWLSVVTDFAVLQKPVLSDPPVLGERYTISNTHEWTAGKEAVPVYVRRDLLESPGETIGDQGSLKFLFTPKLFIIGDGPVILEMINNWLNEDLVLFVQDECNPESLIQFGCDCYPAAVQKASVQSGTYRGGRKGTDFTLESLSKFFYKGTITELT